MVAVYALSRYASLTYLQEINMKTWLSYTPGVVVKESHIDAERRLVVNSWPVDKLPREVKVGVTGVGCVLLQVRMTFR